MCCSSWGIVCQMSKVKWNWISVLLESSIHYGILCIHSVNSIIKYYYTLYLDLWWCLNRYCENLVKNYMVPSTWFHNCNVLYLTPYTRCPINNILPLINTMIGTENHLFIIIVISRFIQKILQNVFHNGSCTKTVENMTF